MESLWMIEIRSKPRGHWGLVFDTELPAPNQKYAEELVEMWSSMYESSEYRVEEYRRVKTK